MSVIALLAFAYSTLPGTSICETSSDHVDTGASTEFHCACAHPPADTVISQVRIPAVPECGDGCACLPARGTWQGLVSSGPRVKEDLQGRILLEKCACFTDAPAYPHPVVDRDWLRASDPPIADVVLLSLRTVVRLT